jgi:cobyrinic acid a,c-diamide synthase
VITSKGTALTDAAVIKGMKEFRVDSGICGVILNKCSSRLYERMKPVLEKETGIPVLGYLPSNADADFPSRHLGLCTAGEISDLQERIERLAALAEGTIDIEKILDISRSCDLRYNTYLSDDNSLGDNSSVDRPLIAVARDESFCFTYDDSIDILKEMGADISFFSPLHDTALPEGADALYLPGGYPELYLEKLSGNEAMLNEIRLAAKTHMPIVAECGGYMYLCRGIMDDDGRCYQMAGILPGILKKTSGLVRFGYASLQANEESLLFEKGDSIRIHSFHHFDPISNEDDERGDAFSFCKASDKSEWKEGFAGSSLYAAFPHIYFPGCRKAVQRLIRAAKTFHKERVEIQI